MPDSTDSGPPRLVVLTKGAGSRADARHRYGVAAPMRDPDRSLDILTLSGRAAEAASGGGAVLRRRLGVIVSLGLLVVLVVTFLTGFVAAALDLNRFAFHKYAAYLAVAIAAAHVALHWRVLVGGVRRWLLGTRAPNVSPDAARRTRRGAARAERPVSRRAFLMPSLFAGLGAGVGAWWSPRGAAHAVEAGRDLGQLYHQWSKPTYAGLLTKSLHVAPQPSSYKRYPEASTVGLPRPAERFGPSLPEVVARRRSVREYDRRPMRLDQLSSLLAYSAGITDVRDPTLAFRAVPSSGALYPLELYLIVFDVEGLEAGVYHYGVERHELALLASGELRREAFRAALSQEMIGSASLVVVMTALFARVQWKYLDRSYRYALLEAGHLGQNVYLAATALGLGPCGIGAFFDDDFNRLLGVDGDDEATVYVMAVGVPVR
jgi:SagB-type dehydrogenase family enzyme